MIILLSYTFESQIAHAVTETLNTPQQMRLCESIYRGREFRDHLVEHIISRPDQYSSRLRTMVQQSQFNDVIKLVQTDPIMFEEALRSVDKTYDDLFTIFDTFDKDQKIIVACPHKTAKPHNVDLFIGWAVRPEDYGIQHLSDHEQVTDPEVAIGISDLHNKWMREHVQNYDIFYDQMSVAEVIEQVRNI